jgi:peptidoglycan/xylan/chitin deacetylase (PgdA/CDA1 family)
MGDDAEECLLPQQYALTFDDGPSPNTPALLSILQAENVKATFLVVGNNVNSRPAVLRDEVAAGHSVVGHSFSHPSLITLTPPDVVAQMVQTEAAFKAAGESHTHACCCVC